ncbi:hypothetical protein C5D04_13685 [Rathayibacter sp. AY1D2]|uniref:hypothetical protein n=1 Tax=unclassified Rathayibacter TaxID=2609250 RepID=UPI000CE7FA6A|nr:MULTISPECIES: hypothetical protein [unclassified Rathayibacter]PPF32064.1 hypothetical protein C5B93_16350 [Rathayibacter sp. AY1A2]PPI10863.1 hypothetical protein C5D04_13685 [Rathayibacter sp. AY1D2]
MTTNDDIYRADRFRRALRWYPPVWRAEHGEVLLGILLDEADDAGRSRPTLGQQVTLMVGGVRHHFRSHAGRSPAAIIPLALATAFFIFYFTVNWSPGINYPGAIGPFTNPSVFAGAAFVVALGLAVAGRTGAARGMALAASAAELIIAFVSASAGWLGPGLSTAAPIAALGLLTALPWRGRVAAAVSTLVLIGLPVLLIGIEVLGAVLFPMYPALPAGLQLPIVCGVLLAIGLAASRAARLERKLPGALGA